VKRLPSSRDAELVSEWVQKYNQLKEVFMNEHKVNQLLLKKVGAFPLLSELLVVRNLETSLVTAYEAIAHRLTHYRFVNFRSRHPGPRLASEFEAFGAEMSEVLRLKQIDLVSEICNSIREEKKYVDRSCKRLPRGARSLFATRNLRLTHIQTSLGKEEIGLGPFHGVTALTRRMEQVMNAETRRIQQHSFLD
jgi:hypothetical protein